MDGRLMDGTCYPSPAASDYAFRWGQLKRGKERKSQANGWMGIPYFHISGF